MRLNINLLGPFSVSTRVTPNLKPLNRAIAKERRRERSSRPAASRTDGGSGGSFGLCLLGLTLLIVAILAIGGFQV